MAELSTLPNIGKEMTRKLKSVDIDTAEKLIEIGSREAFFRLKIKYPQVCLVHLYVLEGAISDVKYNQLSEKTNAELKAFSDELKCRV